MGLIENLLIVVVNLAFVAADMLLLMMLLKIVHDRRRVSCLEPILTAVRPLMSVVLNWFASVVMKVTGKAYPEKTLLALLVICMLVLRFLVISITR